MSISTNSIVSEKARLGEGVSIGHFSCIGDDVVIGAGSVIGNNVTIYPGTVLGENCSVADCAVLGKQPKLGKMSTASTDGLSALRVGDETSIGSHTVLMAGTTIGSGCIVGDNAGVREKCSIGNNTVVGRSVTVENGTTIGSRVRIQSGAYVTAYVTLEDDVFIAPMVVTTNDNYMGRTEKQHDMAGCIVRKGARVGGGSHILPGIEIKKEGFVATGAVVTRDVPEATVVAGVPAKAFRSVPDEELLENQ